MAEYDELGATGGEGLNRFNAADLLHFGSSSILGQQINSRICTRSLHVVFLGRFLCLCPCNGPVYHFVAAQTPRSV